MQNTRQDDGVTQGAREAIAATRSVLNDMQDLLVDDSQKEAVERFLTDGALALADHMAKLNAVAQEMEAAQEQLNAERGRSDKKLRQFLTILQGIDPETAERVREQVVGRIFSKEEAEDTNGHAEELGGMSIREAALTVLRRVKRPMFTAELVEALGKGGRELTGVSSSVLSAALSTGLAKDQFVAHKEQNKNKWSLTEWGETPDDDLGTYDDDLGI